jgi:hypothetical protein
MPVEITGHAVVSADGRIADRDRRMPAMLRVEADWVRFQRALDRAALVVLGQLGHELHRNPGRRRLVVTSGVDAFAAAPGDARASLWNPTGLSFEAALDRLAITEGTVAVTGGQAVFDLFLPRFDSFELVTVYGALLPDGVPCFSTGWPDEVLAGAGLRIGERHWLDEGVRLEIWRR